MYAAQTLVHKSIWVAKKENVPKYCQLECPEFLDIDTCFWNMLFSNWPHFGTSPQKFDRIQKSSACSQFILQTSGCFVVYFKVNIFRNNGVSRFSSDLLTRSRLKLLLAISDLKLKIHRCSYFYIGNYLNKIVCNHLMSKVLEASQFSAYLYLLLWKICLHFP